MAENDLYYDIHVFCCTNERVEGHSRGSCARGGAENLQKYMKARAKEMGIANIRINKSGCLDRCELGPVMVVYPAGVWFHYANEADIDEILTEYLAHGRIVDRLYLRTEQTSLEQTGS